MAGPAQPRTATYHPTIIWGTGTGIDTSAYDDVSGYYKNNPGLSIDGIGRDQARAYAPPAAAAWDLTLDNWSGRFSPGGPIGGFVGRGSEAFLDIDWGNDPLCDDPVFVVDDPNSLVDGGLDGRLFAGTLDTVEQALTRPQRETQCRILGYMAYRLGDKRPAAILEYVFVDGQWVWRPQETQLLENIRTDVAITHLLDACGWPQDMRSIDTGDTLLRYWWLDGKSTGIDILNALLGAEGAGACAYEQAGVFHFEGRQFRLNNPRSLDVQFIFADGLTAGYGADPFANDAGVDANADNILANGANQLTRTAINPAEFHSNPDEVISSAIAVVNSRAPVPQQSVGTERGKIWEYGGPLSIPAGTTVVTEATLSDPFKLAIDPVRRPDSGPFTGPYDYVVAPAGAPLTVTVQHRSGVRVAISWTTTTQAVTVNGDTSNGPQLRAVSLPVASELSVRSTVNTAPFAPRYAAREHVMEMWPEVVPEQALDVVNSMAQRYKQERRQATIRVANIDGDHMQLMMQLRISDRVQWIQRHGGLNDPYWVEQISHEIAPGGGLHIMTLGMERVFAPLQTRFNDAQFGSPEEPYDYFTE